MATKIHPPSESTATFIRQNLMQTGIDYPYHLWRMWKTYLEERDMKAPQWSSFKVYFRVVERAGLVRRVPTPPGVEPIRAGLKPAKRTYFELTPELIDDLKKWRNPQVVVFGERVRLGKRRYRRRILGLPPKTKGGRPRLKRQPY